MSQTVDRANAEFWNELCGTTLARQHGVVDASPDSLDRFDRAYLSLYPYLLDYVQPVRMAGRSVLEIGLGYGTLGQRIAAAGALYHGLDLADGPVDMMAHRLRAIERPPRVIRGSAYELPFEPRSFDYVVSIGCFHHTGQLAPCIQEVHRVLKPRGLTVVMLYNQFSYRQWLRFPLRTLSALINPWTASNAESRASERQRRHYDADSRGVAAPETVFVSKTRVRELFGRFSSVDVRTENCDDIVPGGRLLSLRSRLLGPLGHWAGLDLYITATK